MWTFIPLQCIVTHSLEKTRISSTCTTHFIHNNFFTFSGSLAPSRHRPSMKCMGAKYSVLRFSLSSLLFCVRSDCRQLSCRCIKDVNSQRNTSYLLKRNRAMIYIQLKEERKRRSAEQKSIMHCCDRKICFVFIEIWYRELYLKATLYMALAETLFRKRNPFQG